MTNEKKTIIDENNSQINHLHKVPLTLLQPFESAARNLSFSVAAKELNLSASAISHSIKKLEDILEIKLFDRHTRKIILTHEGEILFEYIKRGLEDFRRGLKYVSYKRFNQLKIHVAPTFASQHLLPILPQFIGRYPNIDIQLSANTQYVRFGVDNFDLDIVYGEKPYQPNTEVIPLALEILTPLCSPAIAKQIQEATDLYDQKLIQCSLQRYQWQGWFEANNLQAPQLNQGSLVCPLIEVTNEIHYIGHYLVYSSNTTQRESIILFRNWLLESLGINRKII